jgi:hypothetical protein
LFNLNDLISDIVEDYNNQSDNENIKLEYEILYPERNNDNYESEKR